MDEHTFIKKGKLQNVIKTTTNDCCSEKKRERKDAKTMEDSAESVSQHYKHYVLFCYFACCKLIRLNNIIFNT